MTNGSTRFSVSQTFSEALAILGARWRAMIGATVLMVFAMLAVYGFFAWPVVEAAFADPLTYQDSVPPSAIGSAMLGGLLALVIAVWLLVTLLKLALEKDAPRGIFASLAGALPRVPSAIGIAFCVLVVMIAVYIAGAIAAAILTFIGAMMGETAGLLVMVLAFGGLLVFVIYVMLGWVAAVPATVAEKTGPVQSMVRSWQLVKGHRLRLVVLFVLTYIAVAILSFTVLILTMPGFWAAMSGDVAAMESVQPSAASLIVFFVLNLLINVGVQLFYACLFAATYRNLATAKDGPAAAPPAAGVA